jgi:hypothetical protein
MKGRIILMLVAAALLAVAVTLSAAPAFAWTNGKHCNDGNGNGNEGCDAGNSTLVNHGGDEVGPNCPPLGVSGSSLSNPGGNNVNCV